MISSQGSNLSLSNLCVYQDEGSVQYLCVVFYSVCILLQCVICAVEKTLAILLHTEWHLCMNTNECYAFTIAMSLAVCGSVGIGLCFHYTSHSKHAHSLLFLNTNSHISKLKLQ